MWFSKSIEGNTYFGHHVKTADVIGVPPGNLQVVRKRFSQKLIALYLISLGHRFLLRSVQSFSLRLFRRVRNPRPIFRDKFVGSRDNCVLALHPFMEHLDRWFFIPQQ